MKGCAQMTMIKAQLFIMSRKAKFTVVLTQKELSTQAWSMNIPDITKVAFSQWNLIYPSELLL